MGLAVVADVDGDADLRAQPRTDVLVRESRIGEGLVDQVVHAMVQVLALAELGELRGERQQVDLLPGARIEVHRREHVGVGGHKARELLGRAAHHEERGRDAGAQDHDDGGDDGDQHAPTSGL